MYLKFKYHSQNTQKIISLNKINKHLVKPICKTYFANSKTNMKKKRFLKKT